MNLSQLSNHLEQLKGKQKEKQDSLSSFESRCAFAKKEKIRWERARELLKELGLKTQQQLQFHVSNLTTMAMEAVFPDPYQVQIEFVPRRNKTECDISFVRNGNARDPMESVGLGAADIGGFALRVAAWCIQKQKTKPVLLLDEPFKHLSFNFHNDASALLKEVSDRLNLQIIMVSHSEEMASFSDKIFEIGIKDGKSKIK